MNKSILILFTWLLLILSLSGQEVTFRHLGVEQGLSQSTATCLLQDSKGYIWVGTSNGLNRYDGYEFKVYTFNIEDSMSISENGISCLFEDSDENLWVGTSNGVLNKFNRQTDSFTRYSFLSDSSFSYPKDKYYDYPITISRNYNNTITTIAQDLNGFLWIGTWGRGLIKFDIKKISSKFYYHNPQNPTSINFNRITNVLVDKDGVIWVATFGGGLNKIINSVPIFEDNTEKNDIVFYNFRHISNDKSSLSDNRVLSVFEDNAGDMWIGTYGGGLNRLSRDRKYLTGKKANFKHFKHSENKNSLPSNIIMNIIQSKDGYLWFGTFDGGLSKFDLSGNSFTNYKKNPNNAHSLSDNDVISLLEDNSGNIWVGTHLGKGVNIVQRGNKKFKNLFEDYNYQKSEDVVWAITEDSKSNLWVGTYREGIYRFNSNQKLLKHYKSASKNDFPGDNHIRAIAEDNYGNIWVGTYSNGLTRFNPVTSQHSNFSEGKWNSNIPANQIQALLIDGNILWVGTFGGGLCKLNLSEYHNSNKIKFEIFSSNADQLNSISDNRIYSITQSNSGKLFIGTYGDGVSIYNPKTGKFSELVGSEGNKLSDNRVMTVYENLNGDLYVGTYGGALNFINKPDGKLTYIGVNQGLKSDAVYSILEGNSGNLWMSTDNGIFRYNTNSKIFFQYDLFDGLQSLEFSGGAYLKASNGVIYFGGIKGINYFNPDSVRNSSFIPQPVITSIKIFDKELIGERKDLVLSPSQNYFSFEFSALDFTNPGDNEYSYLLEGFEENWNFTSALYRKATYTNVPAGEYIFKVKSTNNDKVWNSNPTTISVTILPAFYSTWWFITITAIIILGILYYIISGRVRHLLAIEKLKSNLAADLHDNIGSGLTEISILSELSAQETEKYSSNIANNIKNISDTARQLVDTMSDIVWVINPQRDSLYDLVLRLKDSYSETLSGLGINFKTKNLELLKEVKLSTEDKQNIFLIFKEGINNAIKHSKCSRLTFEAGVTIGKYMLCLNDDGIGFNSEPAVRGNGLKNMKQRAKIIGAEIRLISSLNDGTRIELEGKVKKRHIIG